MTTRTVGVIKYPAVSSYKTSPALIADIERVARAEGLRPSTWVRMTLERAVTQAQPAPTEPEPDS